MAEHGYWPICSTEFGKVAYILTEYCRTRTFGILKDGIRQSSNPTETDVA